jgi:SAM-dependent methyltransferase
LGFEENRLFIYALADMSGERNFKAARGTQKNIQWIRRFFLLKPSTFVVEDLVRTPGAERPTRWLLRSAGEPKIEDGRIHVVEADIETIGDSLLPADASLKKTSHSRRDNQPVEFRVEVTPKQTSQEARFLQVFHLGRTTRQDAPARSIVTEDDKQLELTVATHERVFQLTLPLDGSSAGKIKVTAADGKSLLPSRLLPSGIMPHGPEGARLLERWDTPYRGDRLPGWDVGQPSSHLTEVVEDGTFRPGRAIVLGCGTGTNAIYLADKGFEVIGVDVAPTALAIGMEKARQAGVKVNWVVADVVALPKLETFDLIFDRGCYHHICQYNSAAYVETLRRLSHRGTRALVLAGSPADGKRSGPPRVKEETIRNDFSVLFEFEWLRGIRFDTRDPDTKGPSAWSIHLRKKDE